MREVREREGYFFDKCELELLLIVVLRDFGPSHYDHDVLQHLLRPSLRRGQEGFEGIFCQEPSSIESAFEVPCVIKDNM